MKISVLAMLSALVLCIPNPTGAMSLATTVDEWLDPDLQGKQKKVLEVLKDFSTHQEIQNPTKIPNEDFGFSFKPGTKFDWMCLSLINNKKIASRDRVPFIDLGCGLGQMSTLAVFAGARVDVVDFKETAIQANKTIYTNTKKVIGYELKDSKKYYRTFPENLTDSTQSLWTATPHDIALCSNVVHFFTQKEIQLFATRVFQNITPGGMFFVQTDTPLTSDSCLEFYKSRQKNSLCPGLAVYNKKKESKGLIIIGAPVIFDETIHTIRPGHIYDGEFTENGKVIENKNCYHNVRNLFLVEELAEIFQNAGFKACMKFYMNDVGMMITEEGQLPEIGKPSKACVVFAKPLL